MLPRHKQLTCEIVLCKDMNACPVQSHANIGLTHVASPLPNPQGLLASPYCRPLALAHMRNICTSFLEEDDIHHNTHGIQNVTIA
jgi:hypothetical protein